MLIEQRNYQLETSTVDRYFEAFGQRGLDLQLEHAGRCVGHYVTEIGPHSHVMALWEHDSFEARAAGRAQLGRDREWREIIARVSPMIRGIETRLLVRSPVWQTGGLAA